MNWYRIGEAAILAGLCLSATAFADQLAGMVKTSKGDVGIERAGQRIPAPVGTPVLVADRIKTGADGAVGITLRDHTLLSAGPNSAFAIDKFAFNSTTYEGAISVGVKKGTLAVSTGKIAKEKPESVDFRTPTSVIGVHGTEFVIETEAGDED